MDERMDRQVPTECGDRFGAGSDGQALVCSLARGHAGPHSWTWQGRCRATLEQPAPWPTLACVRAGEHASWHQSEGGTRWPDDAELARPSRDARVADELSGASRMLADLRAERDGLEAEHAQCSNLSNAEAARIFEEARQMRVERDEADGRAQAWEHIAQGFMGDYGSAWAELRHLIGELSVSEACQIAPLEPIWVYLRQMEKTISAQAQAMVDGGARMTVSTPPPTPSYAMALRSALETIGEALDQLRTIAVADLAPCSPGALVLMSVLDVLLSALEGLEAPTDEACELEDRYARRAADAEARAEQYAVALRSAKLTLERVLETA